MEYRMNMTVNVNQSKAWFTKNTLHCFKFLKSGLYEISYEELERENIDMILYSTLRGYYFNMDRTSSMFVASLYYVLPPRKVLLNAVSNYIIDLYTPRALICVTVSTLVVIWLFWITSDNDSIVTSSLRTLQLSIQMTTNKIPKRRFSRILMLSFLLYACCINVIIDTYMSSKLTTPDLTKKIRTEEELLYESDYKLVVFNATMDHFRDKKRSKIDIVFSDTNNITKIIDDYLKNSCESVVLNEFHLNHFKNINELEVLRQYPLSSQAEYLASIRKGHPMLPMIDCWILRIKEAGLDQNYVARSAMFSQKFIVNHYEADSSRKITV